MSKRRHAIVAACLGLAAVSSAAEYRPDWESLDRRPTPRWFEDAKFGIFIHWGVYAVPSWAPRRKGNERVGNFYSEWYWKRVEDKAANVQSAPFWAFHQKVYGEERRYQDFAPRFQAELFDPAEWADLFARAGARYVVLTSKHHDGFCLWPSAESWNWNAMDVGPHRDLAGDLSRAVKAKGLDMGFYYSLYEWFHPVYKADVARYVQEHMLPQLKDLVLRYQPSIVWTDGEWDHPSEVWRTPEFLAWLFNEAPNRERVAVNDRWGKETRSRHGGYYCLEYGKVHLEADHALGEGHAWEENRGMGSSFGYNRNETVDEYRSTGELVRLLVETVSHGGNLLLDIGPTADGRVPVIMQERLVEIGQWLAVNGEAIYGTRRWRESGEGERVRYTQKDGDVYAIALAWPGPELVLRAPQPKPRLEVQMLGHEGALRWSYRVGALRIAVPPLSVDQAPCHHAYVFRLRGVVG